MASQTEELVIDPQEVEKAFMECLYRPEEIKGLKEGEIPKGCIVVEGIRGKFGFHPERLEKQRPRVTEWLKALPHQFRKSGGGGWSFLNACNQENGVQWTSFHERMEQLFCMAMGLKLAECQMPREMWAAFPGGMPYYVINVE